MLRPVEGGGDGSLAQVIVWRRSSTSQLPSTDKDVQLRCILDVRNFGILIARVYWYFILPSVVRLNCLTRLREAKQVAFIQPEDVILISICLYNSCTIRLIKVTYVPLILGV